MNKGDQIELFVQDDEHLRSVLTKQIKSLHIDIQMGKLDREILVKIYHSIVCLCEKLIDFNFCNMSTIRTRYIHFYCHHPIFTSYTYSTLVKLRMNVFSLFDCIHVLEAPFEQELPLSHW